MTGDAPTATVTVTNTGSRPSREVVQVYFRPDEADQPIRLVGWRAATVAPGESARVTVTGDLRLWRVWNTGAGQWDELRGGTLVIARGLGDIRAELPLSRH